MQAIDFILARRSIRKYTDQKLTEQQIEMLLRAGMSAPSCVDNRDWHFLVITKREGMAKIIKYKPGNAEMLRGAPIAILISGDSNCFYQGNPDYWIQDCSAAAENILIAANAMGLGAVWLGIYPNLERSNNIRKAFNMPENLIPFAAVSIGYSAEAKQARELYELDKVHFETW